MKEINREAYVQGRIDLLKNEKDADIAQIMINANKDWIMMMANQIGTLPFKITPEEVAALQPSAFNRPLLNGVLMQRALLRRMMKLNSFEWAPEIHQNWLPKNARIYKAW